MKPSKVRILPGNIVYEDGIAYHAGQILELSAKDAQQLIAAGLAEKA